MAESVVEAKKSKLNGIGLQWFLEQYDMSDMHHENLSIQKWLIATSLDDIQLLDDVVESLQRIQRVSRSSERLYQICSTFAHIARGLVEARKSCVGMYNQRDDSLQFVYNNHTGQMSIFEPDFLPGFLDADMTNHASYEEAHDILDCCATGLPAGMNLFGGSG